MDSPDLVAALQEATWSEVLDVLDRHQEDIDNDAFARAAALAESGWRSEPGHPDAADIWVLLLTWIRGGPDASRAFVSFVAALADAKAATERPGADDPFPALTAVLRSGLAVTHVLNIPLLVDDLLWGCGQVEDREDSPGAVLALAGTVRVATYGWSEDARELDAGIRLIHRALAADLTDAGLGDDARFGAQLALAAALATRDRTEEPVEGRPASHADLLEGIAILRALAAGEHHPDAARRSMIPLLVELATVTRHRGSLDEALRVDEQLRGEPVSTGDRLRRAELHRRAFAIWAEAPDLDAAIDEVTAAVELGDAADDDRRTVLATQQRLLEQRFESTRDAADLRASIRAGEAARDLLESTDPRWIHETNSLAIAHSRLALATSDVDGARRGVDLAEEAFAARPPDNPKLVGILLRNLGGRLADLYRLSSDDGALDRAVHLLSMAVAEGEDEDLELLRARRQLGNHLIRRHKARGRRADLDQAIGLLDLGPEQLSCLPDGERADARNGLALALKQRWADDGNPADLDRAIVLLQDVVDPPEDSRAVTPSGVVIGNLGMFLNERFRARGDMTDLELAIRYTEQALDLYPPDHHHHTGYAGNLANRNLTRFLFTGDDAAADEALRLMRAVVAATGDAESLRPVRLANLGVVLMTIGRERRASGRTVEALAQIEEAVDLLTTATGRLAPDAFGHAHATSGRGHALVERHLARLALGIDPDPDDLPTAIALLEDALTRFPAGPDRGDAAANLALALVTAADPAGLTGSPLERVRALSDEALASTPVTSPHRPEREALAARLVDDPAH